MPAYRSPDEAEIRDPVVAQLRLIRPGARIMHEVNVAGTGSNRIDVLAVDRREIIAVEVKSKKDKIERLTDQVKAMQGVAHHVVAALHEKFLQKQYAEDPAVVCNPAFNFEKDQRYIWTDPAESVGATTWIFPMRRRIDDTAVRDDRMTWRTPREALQDVLPAGAIHMLWREELLAIATRLRVNTNAKLPMLDLVRDIRWFASGREITEGICWALRRRIVIEGDPPVEGDA
jgi:Holliday junction resolvase